MQDILQEIVSHKRGELEQTFAKRRSMKQRLAASPSGIIAEFKRKSPSKGWIHADAMAEHIVPQYAAGGACAVSILTDQEYFGGDIDFIRRVRNLVPDLPILRKEFIIDPYQLYEAKVVGADAVLLIAADLTCAQYADLLATAHRIGLEVLLEVHDAGELNYLEYGTPDMLGVNNRSLGTFHTDVQHSFDIALHMQRAVGHLDASLRPLLVSESGISHPEVLSRLREVGFRGFLIGECFMKEMDPGAALRNFILRLENLPEEATHGSLSV